jgi:hypothetical protein
MEVLAQRHPDALRALEGASKADVDRVVALLQSDDPKAAKDVEDILRSYMYKQQKRARRGAADIEAKGTDGLEPPHGEKQPSLGERLETSVGNLREARERGFPFGFENRDKYETFMTQLRSELARCGINGTPVVQGSAMHSKTPGDVDVEVRVSKQEFDRLAAEFLRNAPTGKLKKNLQTNIDKGKIPSFHFFPNVNPPIGEKVAPNTANLTVQATLIVEGTDFDLGPTL